MLTLYIEHWSLCFEKKLNYRYLSINIDINIPHRSLRFEAQIKLCINVELCINVSKYVYYYVIYSTSNCGHLHLKMKMRKEDEITSLGHLDFPPVAALLQPLLPPPAHWGHRVWKNPLSSLF